MMVIITNQCGIDIFFIDWEREQTFENQGNNQGRKSSKGVSIWRTLLICNEFNELQIERYISRGYTFLFGAFFLM
jgi:meckelin